MALSSTLACLLLAIALLSPASHSAGQQNTHPAGTDPMKQLGFKDMEKYGGMLVTLNTAEWTNGGNNSFGIRGPAPRENPNWSVTPNLIWLKALTT